MQRDQALAGSLPLQTDVGILLQRKPGNGHLVVVAADDTTAHGVSTGDVLVSIDRMPVDELERKDIVRKLKGVRGTCARSVMQAVCVLRHFLD